MDVRFALVVSYRAYGHLNRWEAVTITDVGSIQKKAKHVRRMTTGTACIDGSNPIKLLRSLKLLMNFDDARISEGLPVRILADLLEGSATSFYYTQSGSGSIPSSAIQSAKFS